MVFFFISNHCDWATIYVLIGHHKWTHHFGPFGHAKDSIVPLMLLHQEWWPPSLLWAFSIQSSSRMNIEHEWIFFSNHSNYDVRLWSSVKTRNCFFRAYRVLNFVVTISSYTELVGNGPATRGRIEQLIVLVHVPLHSWYKFWLG